MDLISKTESPCRQEGAKRYPSDKSKEIARYLPASPKEIIRHLPANPKEIARYLLANPKEDPLTTKKLLMAGAKRK